MHMIKLKQWPVHKVVNTYYCYYIFIIIIIIIMYYASDFHFTCHNIFKYKPKRNNSSHKNQLSTNICRHYRIKLYKICTTHQ